ncbi:pentapeptide repeat-containing protein [Magnetococcales bacterium HHB-1]
MGMKTVRRKMQHSLRRERRRVRLHNTLCSEESMVTQWWQDHFFKILAILAFVLPISQMIHSYNIKEENEKIEYMVDLLDSIDQEGGSYLIHMIQLTLDEPGLAIPLLELELRRSTSVSGKRRDNALRQKIAEILRQLSMIKGRPRLSFYGLNFDGVNLKGMELTNMDFINCGFKDARLQYVKFVNVNMTDSDLSKARLDKAIFDKVNISNTKFQVSKFNGTRFSNINFQHKQGPDFFCSAWAEKGAIDFGWDKKLKSYLMGNYVLYKESMREEHCKELKEQNKT